MPTTVNIPMELLVISVNSANAFWTAKSGANVDHAHVSFVDSGEGVAYYAAQVPTNINLTPSWNLNFDHMADSGSGGNVVITFSARAMSNNVYDITPTVVSSAGVYAVNTFNTMTFHTAVSGGNFDGVVTISANQYFVVKVNRHGGNTSDTVNSIWNLKTLKLMVNI